MSTRARYLVLVLLGLVLTGLIYGPLLSCFFDPQDFKSILNPLVAEQPLGQYLTEAWGCVSEGRTRLVFFRPLTSVSFLVDYQLWGTEPAGYRLLNVLLHMAIAFITIPLARRLGIRRYWWFPPLVVLVHPGCMEAVWLIAARNDLLAVGFSLAALLLTVDVRRGKLKGAFGALPMAAALLAAASKELGMINFLALPLLFLLWPDGAPDRRGQRWFWLSLPLALLLTLGSRFAVFSTNIGGYGGYTPLTEWPMEVYIALLQASGVFYISLPGLRHALALLMAVILASPLIGRPRPLRKYAFMIIVFGAFASQSLLAGPARHYVYGLVASGALILGWALEKGWPGGGRAAWMRFGVPATILVLLLSAALDNQSKLRKLREPARSVFMALEEMADDVASLDRVAVILSADSPEGEECRLIRRFLLCLRPTADVEFRFVPSATELRPGEAYLVWECDSLALRTAP